MGLLRVVVGIVVSFLLFCGDSGDAKEATKESCVYQCPACKTNSWFEAACYAPRKPSFAKAASCLDEMLATVPQAFAKQRVRELILRKLEAPTVPLRLLFVGDNGVGKTRLAYIISLALSAKLGGKRNTQLYGDELLELDGTSLKALAPTKCREMIVSRVVEHVRKHPLGIIVVNDLQTFGELLVILRPLIDGGVYPEYPDVNMDLVTLILTMDLGGQGSSRLMSMHDLIRAGHERLIQLTPKVDTPAMAEYLTIVPFVAYDKAAFETVVQTQLRELPCRYSWCAAVQYTAHVVRALAHTAQQDATEELLHANGRRVAELFGDIERQILASLSVGAQQAQSRIPPQIVQLGVDKVGQVTVSVKPV